MSTVGAFVTAHCPYCGNAAEWRLSDDSAWCACLAVRIARDGVTGTVHITIVPAGDQAGAASDDALEAARREAYNAAFAAYMHAQHPDTWDRWIRGPQPLDKP